MNTPPGGQLHTLQQSSGVFRLPPGVRLTLTGADRVRYLNGQVTIDVTKLQPRVARSGLLLSTKGKLCAPLWIWATDEALHLEVPASLADDTIVRLERYIVSDDVAITSAASASFHVFGRLPPPDAPLLPRLACPGYDTDQPPGDLPEITATDFECLRIHRGIPLWGAELGPDTLPQEALLDQSSVDFDKGCYVGQEVVSRLRSVGRVNRTLHAFVGTLTNPQVAPLTLTLPDQPGTRVGTLTSLCPDFELAQTLALGYLNRQFEETDTFAACDHSGGRVGLFTKRQLPN